MEEAGTWMVAAAAACRTPDIGNQATEGPEGDVGMTLDLKEAHETIRRTVLDWK